MLSFRVMHEPAFLDLFTYCLELGIAPPRPPLSFALFVLVKGWKRDSNSRHCCISVSGRPSNVKPSASEQIFVMVCYMPMHDVHTWTLEVV